MTGGPGRTRATPWSGSCGSRSSEERYLYVIRLPANEVLQREIEPLLTRPVGRPSNKPVVWYHDFLYQAGSWNKPRRVVAKIEWHKGPDVRRDSLGWASS